MNDPRTSQNPRVRAALANYLERIDRGERVDQNAFLAEHRDIAEELRSFLAMSAELGKLAGRRSRTDAPPKRAADASEQNTQSVLEAAAQTVSPQKSPIEGAESALGLPEQFGRYRVLKALGGGAMGMVYLAEDTQLDRQVALKIPNFEKDDTGELLERFHREAKAAAKLRHTNICPVYDSGAIDGKHFISMAFIAGKPLASFIRPDRPQTERQCLGVIRKLAVGLQSAHDEGIVHRDLKPANVMVDSKGEPVITDFGLASISQRGDQSRLTQSGMILGSPAYMSPEQIEGEPEKIKPAADQYALGVILYELLTSQLPFRGGITQIIHAIMHKDPQPPSELRPGLDPRVEALCLKMMSKSPADRFPSCKVVADQINQLLKELPAKGAAGESRVAATPAGGTPAARASVAATPVRTMAEKGPAPSDPAKSFRAAEQCMARHEYEQAVRMLEQIPEGQRTAQMNALLEKARQLATEVSFLLEEIGRAGAANDREQALQKVDALARLAPSHPKVSEWRGVPERPTIQKSAPKRPPVKAQGGGFGQLPPAVKIGGGAAAALVLLLGVVLFFRSDKAVVLIEVNDPSIEVALNGETLKLNGASQQVSVTPGDGKLSIKVGDVEFTSESFTLKKGENDAVVVTLVDDKVVASFGDRSLGIWDAPRESDASSTRATFPDAGGTGPLRRTDDPHELDYAFLPAGEFDMGSDNPAHQPDERPKHRVRLTRGFEMSRTEITVAQFRKFVEATNYRTEAESGAKSAWVVDPATGPAEDRKRPGATWKQPGFPQGDDHPVVCVTQKDAQAFCKWLSDQTRRTCRLPTEAEWEYACRARTTGDFWFGEADRVSKCANIADESLRKSFAVSYPKMELVSGEDGHANTAPVGSYEPNAFGLYDMAGNVWELCADMYDGRGYGSPTLAVDPFSTGHVDTKTSPVLRGGSFFVPLQACRSSNRSYSNYDNAFNSVGFRIVRDVDPAAVAAVSRTAAPPGDAEVFQGRAYKYFPERLTWTQAKKRCEELGGRLPIIRNKEQNDFITRLARRNFRAVAGKEAIWIGLNDVAKNGEWRWIDGTLAQFKHWGPRQPNKKKPNQHFVLLKLPDLAHLADGIWADEPDDPLVHVPHLICEWDAPPSAGAVGAARIPPDAQTYQGRAYKYFAELLSWTDAKRRCEQMGGRLPKIENAEQNGFIERLARRGFTQSTGKEAVWIGASDAFKEGDWRWTDGSPVRYTNWGPQQPNNKGGGEDFAILWLPANQRIPDGVWCDQPEVSTDHVVHFICEWVLPGTAANAPPLKPSDILLSDDYEWTEPENLGKGVNTDGMELSPTLTSDEKILMFVREGDVYESRRKSIDEPFPMATRVPPPISRPNSQQTSVSISGDGLLLVVSSNRGKDTDIDIYLAERKSVDEPFARPVLLPSPVSTNSNDHMPVLSPDGLSLIVASDRKGGRGMVDLYQFNRSTRQDKFANEQNLGSAVNTPLIDLGGGMSSDGLVLIRSSHIIPPRGRPSDMQHVSTAICVRSRVNEPFEEVRLFGKPFETAPPASAVLSPDGRRMYFVSRKPEGEGRFDIWLSRRMPKKVGADAAAPPATPVAVVESLPQTVDDGWIDLFNGRDLTGWKQIEGGNDWHVADGIVETSGPESRLLYTARDFGDVHLRAECRLAGGANSGILMRCQETSLRGNGVEAQLAQVGSPGTGPESKYATGSIWQVAPYSKKVVEDNNWFRVDFICRAGTLTVQIDGATTVTAPAPATLHDRGFVGLTHFTAGRTAQFRSIRARPLDGVPSEKKDDLSVAAPATPPAAPAPVQPSPEKPAAPTAGKWESLFNGKDLAGWNQMAVSSGWAVRGGAIAAVPGEAGGWIASERSFSDFELEFEYRLPPNGNSGVFLRIPEAGDVTGAEFLEIQLLDDFGPRTKNAAPVQKTGSLFGVAAASPPAAAGANKWHEVTIRAVGTKIAVAINNRKVLDVDLELFPKSTAAKPNLRRTSGHIGFQRHGTDVEFRKVRIREITSP